MKYAIRDSSTVEVIADVDNEVPAVPLFPTAMALLGSVSEDTPLKSVIVANRPDPVQVNEVEDCVPDIRL
jgi:hypothetical protein